MSKGWHNGESTRLPPMWPGFRVPTLMPYVGRVCCWFSPLLQWFFFAVHSGFPLSSKTNTAKLQFDQELGTPGTTLWMCYL